MNALQIIERLRTYDAELVLEKNRLFVRGNGERLPEELRTAIKQHKTALMVALGAPIDRGVSGIQGPAAQSPNSAAAPAGRQATSPH